MTSDDERLFLSYIQRNPVNRRILQLAPGLGVGDWWLTAGALFQTVWNVLDGRDPGAGIRDYDLFYFDEDTSYEAEDTVIRRAAHLFKDLGAEVEVRNEARVHLWYEEHFGFQRCRSPALLTRSITSQRRPAASRSRQTTPFLRLEGAVVEPTGDTLFGDPGASRFEPPGP